MTDPAHTPLRHERVFAVAAEDIDGQGHVNNLVYLRWIQDVAIEHWGGAARPRDQASTAWVVVRHEIDYLKPALLGDEVVARTWVEVWKGATSERHTELERRGDGVMLARGRTVWCALDAVTRRPKRVTSEMSEPFHDQG
ncbi:MAG TPA: acyl-CoA thioesterase [Longimicrobiales bacterium]|nr:acyl-CoA thioesterase [Longimicrobiales bacterium]